MGAAPADPIRILLANDNRLLGEALQIVLGRDPRFEVVGVAFDGPEAVVLADQLAPDVVLLDEAVTTRAGRTARVIRSLASASRVLVLTDFASELDSVQAHHAGAAAFLRRPRSATSIIDTLELTTLLAQVGAGEADEPYSSELPG